MNNMKVYVAFAIVLILVAVFAVAEGAWHYEGRQPEPHQPGTAAQASTTTQSSNTSATTSSPPPSVNQPFQSSMKSYRDPDGYFSIKIPSSWTAGQDGTGSSGGDKVESIALNSANNNDQIEIDVTEESSSCKNVPPHNSLNATLGGLPAQYYPPPYGWWTVFADDATFQISSDYPGADRIESGGPPDPSFSPPVSPAIASSSQELVNAVINSFQPTNFQQLSC
jgi:hypothetical protein